MKTLPVLRELPHDLLGGIGAVCFEWAQVEHALQLITYGLLKIGPKHGRVAVRSPRATDQVTMIRQLMYLENLTSQHVDMDKLSEVLGKLERHRDMIAHAVWLKGESGETLLQDLGGNWKPDPNEPKIARRIKPEGIEFDADSLHQLAKFIQQTRLTIEGILAKELETQRRALLHKSQPQSDEAHPPSDHTPDMP